MCERLDAIRALKQAASELSDACMDHMGVPETTQPMVKTFEHYALQPVPVDMEVLLGRIV